MSRPNVADWQYLGVEKITRRLEWNSGSKARKGHICEDSLAYASYSSKVTCMRGFKEHHKVFAQDEYVVWNNVPLISIRFV